MIRSLKGSLAVLTAIAALASSARADFEIEIVAANGDTISAPTAGPYGPSVGGVGSGSTSTSFNVDINTLNSDLAAAGLNFKFASLGATTTATTIGGVVTETLTVGAQGIQATGPSSPTSPATFTIFVTNTDYTVPTGTDKTLNSTVSATAPSMLSGTFSGSFISYFDAGNTNYGMSMPSNLATFGGPGSSLGNPPPVSVLGGTPYSLTSATTITLTGPDAVGFNGATSVSAAAVPEPASMTLLFLGAPLAFRAIRRRKTA